MLDDGTHWTAPGLELEFRARLETLISNGFQKDVQLAGCSVLESAESPSPTGRGSATSSKGNHNESASAKEEADEDEDSDGEDEDHQIAQAEEAASTCGPLTPVCVLVIGGTLGTILIHLSILISK